MLTHLITILFLVTTFNVAIGFDSPNIQQNRKLDSILERISSTSPEGLKIIEKIKQMKPGKNEQESYEILGQVVTFYSNIGSISPIGWEASQKNDGLWRIVFHYKDRSGNYLAAEWEYNEQKNNVYPFEEINAPQFLLSERFMRARQGKAHPPAPAAKSKPVRSTRPASDELEGVKFKAPDGYMSADFEHYNGVLILGSLKSAGMFIVMLDEDESMDELSKKIHSSIARMFTNDGSLESGWARSSLPAHKGISNETGILTMGSSEEKHIQVAAYKRTIDETEFIYGYFAMWNSTGKGKDRKPTALFVDKTGKGVNDFDKFWQSIKKSN